MISAAQSTWSFAVRMEDRIQPISTSTTGLETRWTTCSSAFLPFKRQRRDLSCFPQSPTPARPPIPQERDMPHRDKIAPAALTRHLLLNLEFISQAEIQGGRPRLYIAGEPIVESPAGHRA